MSDLIDKAEAKAALQAWLDRHNYPVNPTLFHALDALPARGVGVKPWGWIGGNAACHHAHVNELADGLQSCTSCGAVRSAAIAPTDAAHVNETPKSEHDAGNVLTDAAQAREAALWEAAGVILNDFDALLKVAGKAVEAHNSGLSLTEGVRRGLRALIGEART